MKKFIIAFAALLSMTIQAHAMSFEQARQQALFLTDKMAYELNLTDAQYEAAYEINLDYLLSVDYNDVYGVYWRQRNLDLSYILYDWQYTAYCAASYFYRPLYRTGGYWHFGIYARYPYRDYFFFGIPRFYDSYRGGMHSWRMNGGRSWYHGRGIGHGHGPGPEGRTHAGMRDGFHRGDYGHGKSMGGGRQYGIQNRPGNRSFDNNRGSSTRETVRQNNGGGSRSAFGGSRAHRDRRSNGTFTPERNSRQNGTLSRPNNNSRSGFGSSRSGSSSRGSGIGSSRTGSRSNGSSSISRGSSSRGSSFGGSSRSSSSSSAHSGGFGGGSSFGGGSGSSSHSGGGSHSNGGPTSSSNGHSGGGFGGHR